MTYQQNYQIFSPDAFKARFNPPGLSDWASELISTIRVFHWPDTRTISVLILSVNNFSSVGASTPLPQTAFDYSIGVRRAFEDALNNLLGARAHTVYEKAHQALMALPVKTGEPASGTGNPVVEPRPGTAQHIAYETVPIVQNVDHLPAAKYGERDE